ncbi:MAG: (E)-4-hydroxy-3-methylbut-2-enyl-diphosphate synthase [Candidatus Egerieousia sp.]|nr:(E)-4-hydroxy-3-methylbut-2-enyl-diphosphate synthase [Candidatus Egerieousia sp.]
MMKNNNTSCSSTANNTSNCSSTANSTTNWCSTTTCSGTSAIDVHGLIIGGGAPLVVQTMCNTHTQDVEASVAQCLQLAAAGAQMIRLTTQGLKEVEALKEIKRRLRNAGCTVPLVADVHFTSDVAIAAAAVAEKVRINPGNFAKEHREAKEKFKKFLQVCKEHRTAVRIGLNHGSLGERITNLYGNTPLGMKEAAMEWVEMALAEDFHNFAVSLKASNTVVMVEAYRLLKREMQSRKLSFPLHLGVTEAGNGDTGRIKSAVGIGTLLAEGIGDTIRVSLTENPVNEIITGNIIKEWYKPQENLVSQAYLHKVQIDTQLRHGVTVPLLSYRVKTREEFLIKASCDFGPYLLDKKIDDFQLTCNLIAPDGAPDGATAATGTAGNLSGTAGNERELSRAEIDEFKDNLLQATRRRFTKPEYIACPGCGRTLYNLEETLNRVKARTAHLKGVKIAVMGCIVNGPGEMADADFGYVGEGAGKVSIYKGKEAVMRSVPQEEAIERLLEIIEQSSAESGRIK